MLVVLRIIFGIAFIYVIKEGRFFGAENTQAGDLTSAGYLALAVILSIANAAVWAPYLGDKVSDPLTGPMTRSTYVEPSNYLGRFIVWLQNRGWRRLVVFVCFLEGIHYPDRPGAFVIGMRNAKPGSWLEKVFAREVYRFDNAQHCVEAHRVLKRHGIVPACHHNPEVAMVLLSLERSVKPDPTKLAVPTHTDPPALKRNRRIQLFKTQRTKLAD
jgi:hypothetical protein